MIQRRASGPEGAKEPEELSERGTTERAEMKSHGIAQPSENKGGREMTAVSKEQRKRTERTTVTQEMCMSWPHINFGWKQQDLQRRKGIQEYLLQEKDGTLTPLERTCWDDCWQYENRGLCDQECLIWSSDPQRTSSSTSAMWALRIYLNQFSCWHLSSSSVPLTVCSSL